MEGYVLKGEQKFLIIPWQAKNQNLKSKMERILETSSTFTPEVINAIQERAELGRYMIRGYGALRNVPRFDDLVFLTTSLTRLPLEGYREKCTTKTVLGTRYAKRPMELDIPITIAGMSFGALSRNAKVALGQAATLLGNVNDDWRWGNAAR